MREKSHELHWLEAINIRSDLDTNKKKSLQQLQRGYYGEVNFDVLCKQFLNSNIQYLNDITIQYHSNISQIDKLIFSKDTLYLVDMKYYKGNYTYKNNQWYAGTKLLTHNIYEQLRRATRIIQSILDDSNLKITVHGVLAFMNPESVIQIHDSVFETTLAYSEIYTWLSQINLKTDSVANYEWINVLNNYKIDNYKTTHKIGATKLHSGIHCIQCGSFNISINKHTVSCQCGHIEVKETAVVRTICEYGLIYHDKDFKRIELKKFLDNSIKEVYLKNILKKHFELKQSTGHTSCYHNKGLPFDSWFKNKMDYFNKIGIRKRWKNANVKF